ncbi:unnamed protein product [Closterium sp. NIES-53]
MKDRSGYDKSVNRADFIRWYAGRQRGGGAGPCTYVLRTGDRTGEQCGGPHSTQRCFGRLTDAWHHQFPDATEIPRWGDLSRAGVAVFDLDYDAILAAMYALSTSDEGDCCLCVPPDPGIEAAALGAGETAALGASASAAPGAGESAPSGTASAQVFHTFTLDSGASRSFFRDRTTLTPLSRPVADSLADPSGGPVLASFSTVLPCPAAPSGSLSGLYLPSFSTNLEAASSQVLATASGSGPASAPCSCRLLSHQTLLWHHRLGHPSLPRLRGSCVPCVHPRPGPPSPPSLAPSGLCSCALRYGASAPSLPTGSATTVSSQTTLSSAVLVPPVNIEVWIDDMQLFLQCDSKDGLSLFDLTSGASTAPAADADSTVRSQWTTRDAAARLAVHSHLPSTERTHFSQYKSAKTLYDAVVARYSSPATAALSRLMLPYLFPDLAAFATVTDLITHLRTSDTRYRAALPAEDHFLSLCPTTLTIDFLEERLLAAETSITAVGASRGDPRMAFRVLVSGLPRSLPPLPPGPAPTCVPWVEGRQRATPHSSEFPPTEAPLQTLHMDVGGEFSSDLLRAFCRAEGIRQTFTLPAYPQQNGIAERRINMYAAHQINLQPRVSIPETSPTLRWTGKVGDASAFRVWGSRAFVRNLSADKLSSRAVPCVFLGFPPDAPGWQFYHPTSRRVLSSQDVTFDKSVPYYHALEPVEVAVDSGASRGAEPDRAEPGGAGPGGAEPERAELGGAESGGAEPERAEPWGAGSGGAEPGVAESGGGEPDGAGPGGPSGAFRAARAGGAAGARGATAAGGAGATGPGGARTGGTGAAGPGGAPGAGTTGGAGAGSAAGVGATGGTGAGATASSGGLAGAGAAGGTGAGGATGAGAPMGAGVGATGAASGAASAGGAAGVRADAAGAGAVSVGSGGAARSRPYFVPLLEQLASPLPAPSPYADPTGGLAERREPESRPASPVRTARTSRRVPQSSLPALADPESDSLRAASPTVTRLLATVVTDPSFESTAASALVAELVDFAAHYRLDYAASLVAESESLCPPSVWGECALSTNVLEDRQEEFQCFAAALPHLVSMLLPPEGDPDAPDIPTPRSYAEAIEGTYVDEVPPPGANIVSGMWIFRVKRPPGSPLVFKARYVARGFSQRQGVEYFQTFSPTPKMTTLRVLLHVAAQRDYELHSLDFSTAFLQGSLHEEIWLRRPPGFTGSFPPGTQWSLRRLVYGLCQAPCEWHDTLRTTLAALGFAPSTADPSLFLRTDTLLPPFYILVYVDDLVFATADTAGLAHVKSELQKRHTCTDLGELRSYLGLQITRDRARRTITLTQSHMVLQVLQCFDFTYSSPQATPLFTRHSLSALPSDESVEPSGPYPELVGCLITLGMRLVLGGWSPVVLTGHADASWVDDLATQRSSQGYTFSLGSGSVSWRSTCSSSVLSSSCEASIYTGAMAAHELRWPTYLLTDLGEPPRFPPILYVDNKAILALCREHRLEHRTKHIALRYFLARELHQRGQLRLAYVASQANAADIFTKALQPCDHQRFCTMLGLVPTWPHLLTS